MRIVIFIAWAFAIAVLRPFIGRRDEAELSIWGLARLLSLHLTISATTKSRRWLSYIIRILRPVTWWGNTVLLAETWLRLVVHWPVGLCTHPMGDWTLVLYVWTTCMRIERGIATQWWAHTALVGIVWRCAHNRVLLIWIISWTNLRASSDWSLWDKTLLLLQHLLVAWPKWALSVRFVCHMTCLLRLWHALGGLRMPTSLHRVHRVAVSVHIIAVVMWIRLQLPWRGCHGMRLVVALLGTVLLTARIRMSWSLHYLWLIVWLEHFFSLFHLIMVIMYFLALSLPRLSLLSYWVLLQLLLPTAFESVE